MVYYIVIDHKNTHIKMSSSESESDDNCSYSDFCDGGISPFLFQPMYTEEEIDERVTRYESGQQEVCENAEKEKECSCNDCIDMNIEDETLCCVHALKDHWDLFGERKMCDRDSCI